MFSLAIPFKPTCLSLKNICLGLLLSSDSHRGVYLIIFILGRVHSDLEVMYSSFEISMIDNYMIPRDTAMMPACYHGDTLAGIPNNAHLHYTGCSGSVQVRK